MQIDWFPLWLSLRVAFVSTAVALALGLWIAYILANRLIFYKALRDKFTDLPRLRLPPSASTPTAAYQFFQSLFERAVRRSGDYEPLFYPHERDWASKLVFEAPGAHPFGVDIALVFEQPAQTVLPPDRRKDEGVLR